MEVFLFLAGLIGAGIYHAVVDNSSNPKQADAAMSIVGWIFLIILSAAFGGLGAIIGLLVLFMVWIYK